MVGNMRKRKKGRERQRNRQKPFRWLSEPLLSSLRTMPRGTQVKRDGFAISVERRGTSSEIALRHLSHPWLHVWSARDHTGGETAPRGVSFRGQTLKTIRAEGAQGSPHKLPILIMPEEPRVLMVVGGQSINFLLDTGAT